MTARKKAVHDPKVHTDDDAYHGRDRHRVQCGCGYMGPWRYAYVGAAADANMHRLANGLVSPL